MIRLRKAVASDVAAIEKLIGRSVRGLSSNEYTARQIELAIGSVFGVDLDLIDDGTYIVAESDGRIVACGGWSRRKTLFGASGFAHSRDPGLLDPAADAAKIRAFFVDPDAARQGIATAILEACEDEARTFGFNRVEMAATLPGVNFYEARGYHGDETLIVSIGGNERITCIRMEKDL